MRGYLLLFRLSMAWIYLYATSHQAVVSGYSVAGFLAKTKTFHAVFAPLADPSIAPVLSFLVAYGHLAIGLSLLVGFAVRVSGFFGCLLMLFYWAANMDFPYIESKQFGLIEHHLIYALLCAFLVQFKGGHAFGLDGFVARQRWLRQSQFLRWMVQG